MSRITRFLIVAAVTALLLPATWIAATPPVGATALPCATVQSWKPNTTPFQLDWKLPQRELQIDSLLSMGTWNANVFYVNGTTVAWQGQINDQGAGFFIAAVATVIVNFPPCVNGRSHYGTGTLTIRPGPAYGDHDPYIGLSVDCTIRVPPRVLTPGPITLTGNMSFTCPNQPLNDAIHVKGNLHGKLCESDIGWDCLR